MTGIFSTTVLVYYYYALGKLAIAAKNSMSIAGNYNMVHAVTTELRTPLLCYRRQTIQRCQLARTARLHPQTVQHEPGIHYILVLPR